MAPLSLESRQPLISIDTGLSQHRTASARSRRHPNQQHGQTLDHRGMLSVPTSRGRIGPPDHRFLVRIGPDGLRQKYSRFT